MTFTLRTFLCILYTHTQCHIQFLHFVLLLFLPLAVRWWVRLRGHWVRPGHQDQDAQGRDAGGALPAQQQGLQDVQEEAAESWEVHRDQREPGRSEEERECVCLWLCMLCTDQDVSLSSRRTFRTCWCPLPLFHQNLRYQRSKVSYMFCLLFSFFIESLWSFPLFMLCFCLSGGGDSG